MAADTARRILDSVNFSEIKFKQKAVSVAAKTKRDTVRVTKEYKFFSIPERTCKSKNL